VKNGAHFFITQPPLVKNEDVDGPLRSLCDDVIVEAWMSKKIELFYKSVGRMTPYRTWASFTVLTPTAGFICQWSIL